MATDENEEVVVLYQVQNFDRQELFYGLTAGRLDKEIQKLALDPQGPAAGWKKGEVVSWRPIVDGLKRKEARVLHAQFESKPPPNKFKVIKTFKA